MKLPSFAFALTAGLRLAAASNISAGKISTNFQFGNSVEIEDLVVRPNGNILFTTPSPSAEVWQINPAKSNGSAERVAALHSTSALGIAQVDTSVYAVSAGNLSSGMSGVMGSFAIHLLDLSKGRAEITREIPVPEAKFLSKLSMLNTSEPTLLASDSQRGRVHAIDLKSGKTRTLLQDAATMNSTSSFPNGVNGIQHVGNHIYYTNSAKGLFCRTGISSTGSPSGKFETVANITTAVPFPDNFAIRPDGHAFISGSNQVLHVAPDGEFNVIAGGAKGTQLAGVTSAKFGAGQSSRTLFVTSSGHISMPGASYVEPGKIVSFEVLGL